MMKTSPTINLKDFRSWFRRFGEREKHGGLHEKPENTRKQEKIRLEQEQEAKMQEQRLQFVNQSNYTHFVTKKTTEDEEELIREKRASHRKSRGKIQTPCYPKKKEENCRRG